MTINNPSFKSDIFYSVQNEDYQTELAVLRRIYKGSPQRVLMVASSGENALSLLTQDTIAQVHAVDINPAQLHLCELRRAALEHLTRNEQLLLLGADPLLLGAVGASERLSLLDQILPHLPESVRDFWNERRHREVTFGIQHVGRNEVAMHDIQRHLQAAGFAPLERPLKDDELPAWKAVYIELMTPAYIHDLFGLPSEGLAAKIAGIAGYLGECHFRALQQPQPEHNYFLTTVFANSYARAAGDGGLPLYLQTQGQTALARFGTQERLYLHPGNILEQMKPLTTTYGPFDLISISNIADWLSDTQFSTTVNQVSDYLKLGGALLARTGTGSRMIIEVMGQHMQMEETFNADLLQVERAPWFRTIAAGFRA